MSVAAACVFPSFPGSTPPDWIRRFVANGGGGIVLFSYNVDSPGALAALGAALRAERGDLLLAIDEEGGDVTRLEWREGSSYPTSAALGILDDPALTEEVAAAIAEDLAAVGVNWNFAPVADINVPENPVIGTRAFGSDPELVARHVAAAVRGTQRAGVAACAKHFPGHGSTVEDSHLALPVLEGDVEAGLLPFRAAIEAGVQTIMTAHISVHGEAATLDRSIVHDLLRSELGFDGVVLADALEMKGVSGRHDVADAAVLALEAGCDALIVGHDLGESEVTRIVAALAERVPEERLAEAAGRVARLAEFARPRIAGAQREHLGEASAHAIRVTGDPVVDGAARVVELRPVANIAAGEAEHRFRGAVVVREGETVPDADVYIVRDVHRHAWMREADRPGAVIVELGLPVWEPRRARGYVVTYGGGRAAIAAAEAVVGARSRS